jgi:hypothetical protein
MMGYVECREQEHGLPWILGLERSTRAAIGEGEENAFVFGLV